MPVTASAARPLRRLLLGGSLAALTCGLVYPAEAQLARLRTSAGAPTGLTAPVVSIPLRPANMREAQERAAALQSRADQIRGYVTSARDAAIAATRTRPTDGLSANGLDPIAAVREAAALQALGGADNIARAAQLLASVSAANDATGVNTWEGASAPVQSVSGGQTTVSITQTQERALLSWNRFDVGANTTLQFNQKQNGVAQPGWTVVNRVVESIAPSTILGSVKADGTVLVLNRNGVIFGETAQVNLHALLASSLDIGNYGRDFRDVQQPSGAPVNVFDATTIKDRNNGYLQNGLFAAVSSSATLPGLLLSSLYASGTQRTDSTPALEGDVTIDAGARITADTGGYLIFAGPKVSNAGALSATEGQVSLQGGRLIAATRSTGAASSADADVRGLILRTIGTVTTGTQRRSSAAVALDSTADDGSVLNRGVIDSKRGYLSLGAGLFGDVTNAGLLAATTSVSRNGKISLTAGTVTIAGSSDPSRAGGIVILPDASAETIPQGTADAPPAFKTSVVEIGARADDSAAGTASLGLFIPSVVSLGQNALILAPSANVTIGRAASTAYDPTAPIRTLSAITIATGAVIDVSGVKDVQLAAARNSIEITPVKRNELRDTPNYREVSLTGDFTLNGSTLFVDPRRSGVREDGVAWIGSPLIEAGSIASQIGVTAAELMTKGGNVSLGVNLLSTAGDIASTPRISIATGATIDFSGGWVHYNEGVVRTSNLLTSDGRIVNIGDADPNDIFVGVADGFTAVQPRFGQSDTFTDPLLQGGRVEAAYDEGRDAGSLVIGGSSITVGGTLFGNAFAGARQRAGAVAPRLASTIALDPRLLQRSVIDLPSGGFLRIGSLTGATGVAAGGDIEITHGAVTPSDGTVTRLDDAMLSASGVSALTLQTSGAVHFTGASDLRLADGGQLTVDAGRGIAFDGNVTIASGTIAARTYELSRAPIAAGSLTAIGSPFRDDDDIGPLYAVGAALPHPFDITVSGTLSTAGKWINDYATTGLAEGGAWTNGGSISLTVAPKVLVALGDTVATAQDAGDLSGSIVIDPGALLNVSAGGYVAPDRSLRLTARGGNIALVNETTYASTVLTVPPLNESAGRSDSPIAGSNQSVDFTPTDNVVPALVPSNPVARVSFSESSLRGFGFAGGGTFTLVAPDISFGSDIREGSAHISLDFFRTTGFGTLDATTFRSRFVPDIFTNARQGNSAFFETTTFAVKSGETLDLTQSVLPSFLDARQAASLLSLASGADITRTLTPGVPASPFDRVAANLTLGGLTELDVMAGGRIIGAAGGVITTPKLLNEGTIAIHGGSIVQRDFLPFNIAARGLGVSDPAFGGAGLADVFGPADANGQFDENAANAAGIFDPLDPARLITNRELLSRPDAERFVYFLGALGQSEGIRFGAASVTDLSGVALVNSHAAYLPSGVQLVTGRVVAGGSVSTANAFTPATNDATRTLFSAPRYGNVRYLNAADNALPPIVGLTTPRTIGAAAGATLDISGASGAFDQLVSPIAYARVAQWSNGGTLSVGGGGSIANLAIAARGGDPRAFGGTLAWVRPTITQTTLDDSGSNVVAADQIMASGFDTVNALGGVTFDGNLSLTLGRAFTVQSIPSTNGVAIANEAQVTVSATDGAQALVIAPYVRFASRLGTIPQIGGGDVLASSVTFRASTGIDFVGGILFDSSIALARFDTPGDVRFIGVDDRPSNSLDLPSLNGRVIAFGNIDIDAGRVYATTGTGNLQRFIEDRRAGNATTVSPFLLAALGDSTIHFGGSHINATTPLSAGSYLKIQAARIAQDGYLAAPLGLLEIGSNEQVTLSVGAPPVQATTSLTFGAGSITTVSGAGTNIPYGTTTDLTEYFFAPSVGLPITAVPTGQLTLGGGVIDVQSGAKIDGRGGGDVFAFEFVSGTGGSHDLLDRFNRDPFSSNDYNPVTGIGYQYADRRQVYAIVPADQARALAEFDPIYSADYNAASGSDLYGAQFGQSVTLDAAPGIAAGQYILLPAHYALLPGAYRVVENVGAAAPAPGATQVLLDGSIVVGGNFSTAGTNFSDSVRRSFTVQSQATFLKFSRIATTGGTATVVAQAAAKGEIAPRAPLDAARVVLSPKNALTVAGVFDTAAAAGGRGAQFDLVANNIVITGGDATPARRTLVVSDTTLQNLNANSLSIGAVRSENADGTTNLGVVAKSITVESGASLSAPELILAVGGRRSLLNVQSGATLIATGKLDDSVTGDYIVPSFVPADVPNGYPYDPTGVGAVLRLSSGAERLIDRQGAAALANAGQQATLKIGAATLRGKALALDSSRDFAIADFANLDASLIAVSGNDLRFGRRGFSQPLLTSLAAADRLTLRSDTVIRFDAGTYHFNDLTLDSPGLSLTRDSQGTLTLDTGVFTLENSSADTGSCGTANGFGCGTAASNLIVNATGLSFGSGAVHTYGFGGTVTLTGTSGAYVDGKGSLDVGSAGLALVTPFLVDRGTAADPRDQAVRPDYTFATSADVTISAPAVAAGATAPVPVGSGSPGARIAFGTSSAAVASLTITDTLLRATSGLIDLESRGNVTLAGKATLATPGYTRTFGDTVDSVTVSAGAGTISLVSLSGNLALGAGTTLQVDSGVGGAGALNLLASNGAITLGSTINPGVTGARDASLTYDSGVSGFDFGQFVTAHGQGFQGDIAIRSGSGDLSLAAGQVLRARSIALTADGGSVTIGGTLDTSGVSLAGLSATAQRDARVNGGDITLYGDRGVTLAATALLDTHTSGYLDSDTRSASAGDVTIGIGRDDAAIVLAPGARIDAGARRTEAAIAAGGTGNRLVAQTVKDPFSLVDTQVYRLALADTGGIVGFRAPVIGDGGHLVDIRLGGTISGAGSVEVEGFTRYDLNAIANSGLYSGVHADGTAISLDFAESAASTGLRNILTENFTDGNLRSVANFIQTFAIDAVDGSSLDGIRLRPGVELDSQGDLALATNWNLGAGTVDQAAAIDAGILQVVPQLGLHADGTPYYAVAPGREAELFQNYVSMLYRVGGRVDGEAGVVTLRARGALDVAHSISDGFFSFRDRTDPGYMSYQLGGGDRTVHPAGTFGCGTVFSGDCSGVASFYDIVNGNAELTGDTIATISLVNPVGGSDLAPGILAPYSALANSAAALGSGTNGAGDPLGGADLFPLLNGGATAVRSTSLRLVGGADANRSSDPLHVDRASGANVLVRGEQQYSIVATRGSVSFDGGFELRLRPNPNTLETQYLSATPEAFINAVANSANSQGLDASTAGDYYTVLNWGSGTEIADTTRNRAKAFFAKAFPDAKFQKPKSGGPSTGVAAPLSAIIAFLAKYGDTYAKNIESGAFSSQPPAPGPVVNLGRGNTAYVGTVVRTGDGSIAIAAANNVDLRRTPDVVYRNAIGTTGKVPDIFGVDSTSYQVGGSAVYTAGHLLTNQPILAAIGSTTIRFDPNPAATTPAFDQLAYQPSIKGQFLNNPALLVDGGDVSIRAVTGDVLARRDVWAEQNLGVGSFYAQKTIGKFRSEVGLTTYLPVGFIGSSDQRWRVGAIGENTQISVIPQLFTSGVGALGGGDVGVVAGGAIRDLTLALDTSVTTANPLVPAGLAAGNPLIAVNPATGASASPTLLTFTGGNATISAGTNLIGGQFDIASGAARVTVGGDVVSAGGTAAPVRGSDEVQGQLNEFRIRVADATLSLDARGSVTLGGIGALGVLTSANALIQDAGKGFFSANAGVEIAANGSVTLGATRPELRVTNFSNLFENSIGFVLPPSLGLTSLTGDIAFSGDAPRLLFPSVTGQLSLLAGGEISGLSLAMSDSDPSLLPGAFSARFAPGGANGGLDFGFNGAFPSTSDVTLRLFHNERTTHADDDEPARIYAGGSITGSTISLPKQARIGAGLDIVDLFFVGQNARPGDITRITAGRDIIGTTRFSSSQRRPYINGNTFLLGGFGTLAIEAGRNLGPFLNSATVGTGTNAQSYAGGIRTVGNDLNPWLPATGADIEALFGIANGANYDALQSTYLDPANAAMLDGDLFVQVSDESGNLSPDRTRPVYAPILAKWLKTRAPAAFTQVFGDGALDDAALTAQSYAKFPDLYAAFAGLDNLTRRSFLINQLYFNELAQTSIPTGPSFQQFVRGYRAAQILFPPSLGYTDNLAPYTTDPSTVRPDHPLGVPTRTLVDGQPVAAQRIVTGNVDLRLATIETVRGGDITILGPGGDVVAGSVVRTSDQAARRATLYGVAPQAALENGILSRINQLPITAIPIGFEGVLTLRGGSIRSFTDGDFRLNQSRLFTLGGGDITLWSSNGDLNAGQGPRTASSFPPVTIRFDLNGLAEVDSAGSVAGAGIGAFKRSPDDPGANIILVAPVGEVDAGDAGVRASGNVFVAAARVANADNFSAGGELSGVPSGGVAAAPSLPTDAASSIVGNAARLAAASSNATDRESLISVDVLGAIGGKDDCDDPDSSKKDCPPPSR